VTRLPPLPVDQWDDEVRRALSPLLPVERANPRDAGNILATLVRHPALTKAYLALNAHLLRGATLPDRVREVALLRVVHRRGSAYLWSHHVPYAQRAGLTAADVDGIRSPDPARRLADPLDRLVVASVDEFDGHNQISEPTWAALSRHFDERQRLDLMFAIGCYALLSGVVNTLDIEDETD
jgi:alkylhydroperoxidase family enzyme